MEQENSGSGWGNFSLGIACAGPSPARAAIAAALGGAGSSAVIHCSPVRQPSWGSRVSRRNVAPTCGVHACDPAPRSVASLGLHRATPAPAATHRQQRPMKPPEQARASAAPGARASRSTCIDSPSRACRRRRRPQTDRLRSRPAAAHAATAGGVGTRAARAGHARGGSRLRKSLRT